jgi:hypothetical protein
MAEMHFRNSSLSYFIPDFVKRPLAAIEDIEGELDLLPQDGESRRKLLKAVREFRGYIEANQKFISNYRDR